MKVKGVLYIITNNCYWYDRPKKKKRSPHYIEVCNLNTGEIEELKNGTIIKIIKRGK